MHWRLLTLLAVGVVAFVLPASHVSALGEKPVISHIKTGQTGELTNEFIAIYNNSETDINITNWCVYYSSSSNATNTKLGCLLPPENTQLFLESFGYLRLATSQFKSSVVGFEPDLVFSSTMSASGGHIKLFDAEEIEIDRVGWGTAANPETLALIPHQSGMVYSRKSINQTGYLVDLNTNSSDFEEIVLELIPSGGIYEKTIDIDVCQNIDGPQSIVPDDYFEVDGICHQDQCDNLEGLQQTIPESYESLDGENCIEIEVILEDSILSITELLPNASSSDTGKEFIEIYNPNPKSVSLKGYELQLGPSFDKKFIFGDEIINPFAFKFFSDVYTKITLPNSMASLRLVTPAGSVVSEVDTYESPKDDESWSLINEVWQYTSVLTPGSSNQKEVVNEELQDDEELESCGPGKFRNPETNRCKTIESVSELSACSEGQTRNPETNRCRGVTSADSLVPCKEGQERNPGTNRCRNIASTASALVPCKDGEERNPETNRCRKISTVSEVASANVIDSPSAQSSKNSWTIIGLILIGVLGYAVYEWRAEIIRAYKKLLNMFSN